MKNKKEEYQLRTKKKSYKNKIIKNQGYDFLNDNINGAGKTSSGGKNINYLKYPLK